MDNATSLDQYLDVGRRGRVIVIDAVSLMFADDCGARRRSARRTNAGQASNRRAVDPVSW